MNIENIRYVCMWCEGYTYHCALCACMCSHVEYVHLLSVACECALSEGRSNSGKMFCGDRGTVGPWALFLCLSFSMRLFMDATDAKLARLQRLG